MTGVGRWVGGAMALALATACTGGEDAAVVETDASAVSNNALGLTDEEASSVASNSVLFWSHEEKIAGFPAMEAQFPTNTVVAGPVSNPLPVSDQTLEVSFEVPTADGGSEMWTVDDFMAKNNTAGLMVVKDGEIVLEEYGEGLRADGRWTSFSVAKSFSSTLVGAAIKDGLIGSVDDPIVDYVPELEGSAYEGVSIRQVLNMTSGVAWNEDYEDPNSDVARFSAEPSINGSDPVVAYMARLPREAEPGTKWVYKTGETNLVGSLVRAATGKSMADYLTEKVWQPYGMNQDAVWMLDLGAGEIAGCCISVSLKDYARFGHFFMHGAEIDGESIVPADWIEQATTSTPAADEGMGGTGGYGFQWWLTNGPAYRASGIFGQGIWMNPEKDLVIVTLSAWPGATDNLYGQRRQALVNAIEAAY